MSKFALKLYLSIMKRKNFFYKSATLLAFLAMGFSQPVEAAESQLDSLHAVAVKDTATTRYPKYYNRDEFHAAFALYNQAQTDASLTDKAIDALQNAIDNLEYIKDVYNTARTTSYKLRTLTRKTSYAGRDSIASLFSEANTIYRHDTTNRVDRMKEITQLTQFFSRSFHWYCQVDSVRHYAFTQANYSAFPGLSAFRQQMAAIQAQTNQTTDTTAFASQMKAINQALSTYRATRPSEWVTIQNGNLWRDDRGQTVQAHAPGFVRVGDIWYMCGEDRSNSWNPDVNLYSSIDLVHWKFEKKIIQNGVTSPSLGSSRFIERPKLLYNARTGKYLVWCHWEQSNYGASEAACFECDSVNGAYQMIWSGRPLSIKSRDCNVFQDNDGTAWFISTIDENQHLGLFKFSDDYHKAVSWTQLFTGQRREAPAIVRVGDRYFMFNSACSGWDPNQCKMSHSTDITSGWTSLTNVGNGIAYDTQAAAIIEIKGTKATTYLYVGDRWQDPDLPNTKTIIFPISFNGTNCNFAYHERFDINFVTGEWRETPTEGHFADKTGWKVTACSSEETKSEDGRAANAIDGNLKTIWHTQYSSPAATAPHSITVDMGELQNINGFLATPRMDNNTNGLIRNCKFETSQDGTNWSTAYSTSWLPYDTEVAFSRRDARYFRLTATEGTYASLAEINVVISGQPTDIEDIEAENQAVVETAWYDLAGRRIIRPQQGQICIVKSRYTDGHTHSRVLAVRDASSIKDEH